ncbi:apicoplast triosephosphate translocator APT1 [Cardiosporidium cionae]|uniref:Apicoplast triosephosphate translocator APT1 n=1 Tax=Cardiosporidium cionae TaxID=476202 RepID=A0ABQ7J6L4_9APIC|nr:apicoplast triosephosphate translocator APT1 [Cardiosporidium cionae]|eukprot:KAF8819634.1 apicoplast triosephosphate translocator APT1 [Cardiosporidium cionae]
MSQYNSLNYGSVTSSGADIPKKELPPVGGFPNRSEPTSAYELLKTALFVVAWYLLNVLYNIDNKTTLIMFPLPWTVAASQLLLGWVFIFSMWILKLRPFPILRNFESFCIAIVPQGICHLLVHIGAVVSINLGAVSFTHIVKAGEPVITAILSGFILKDVISWQTSLTLIPIVSGVALASLKELSFTWKSFAFAMVSNFGSSGRAIFAKKVMADPSTAGENLSSSNLFALVTIVATVLAIPVALVMEGPYIRSVWIECTGPESLYTGKAILTKLVVSAAWYYAYNEVAFICLSRVNQITHSVLNTIKRIVIIVSAIVFFRTPLTPLGSAGSAIAILGTFLYSMSKRNK